MAENIARVLIFAMFAAVFVAIMFDWWRNP
jgi:hypothetical protein